RRSQYRTHGSDSMAGPAWFVTAMGWVRRHPAYVALFIVGASVGVGVFGGIMDSRSPAPTEAGTMIARQLRAIRTLETCLRQNGCGEVPSTAAETIEASHTESHRQLNARLRHALRIARGNQMELQALKREVMSNRGLLDVANEETADAIGDL